MAKDRREGKVFLDWFQNNGASQDHHCAVLPAGVRIPPSRRRERGMRSPTPLRQMLYQEVLDRVSADGDLLAGLDAAVEDRLTTYRSMRNPAKTP